MKTKTVDSKDESTQSLWRMLNGLVLNFAPVHRLHPVNVLMMVLDLAVMALANYSECATADYLQARADGLNARGMSNNDCHSRAMAAGQRIFDASLAEAEALERRLS